MRRTRSQSPIGPTEHDPVHVNLRQLAAQTLLQAVRDAKGHRPRLRDAALGWLNSDDGRAMATALGLRWGQAEEPITVESLPSRARHTYFRGD